MIHNFTGYYRENRFNIYHNIEHVLPLVICEVICNPTTIFKTKFICDVLDSKNCVNSYFLYI